MAKRAGALETLGGRLMFGGVYQGRRVLVTGHTGFKGSWLGSWLLDLGATVAGFSLDVPTVPANFEVLGLEQRLTHIVGDVRDRAALTRVMETFAPEIVFHLAAQSLVRRSYEEPALTLETNALGTLNVLECLRQHGGRRVGVIITSDKCYYNREWSWGYRENDALGGTDPYGVSKACAELVCQAYHRSYFRDGSGPLIATTRAGNVIGGGDWASNRIVPDCMRAWSEHQPVLIRQPQATRPWQHVLEPLSGYLWLGARLWQGDSQVQGEAFNFGPAAEVNQSVAELISHLARHWPGARWETAAASEKQRESTLLKLCCDKALDFLGWHAALPFSETVRFTAEWYRHYYEHGPGSMYDLTCRQIATYSDRAAAQELAWSF